MSVKEIEKAITQLSPEEVAKLSAWLADYQAKPEDKRIKAGFGRAKGLIKMAPDFDEPLAAFEE